MTFSKVKRDDLLFPDLSFQIVGCAFEVFNELGPGHSEKNYQNALAYIFKLRNIQFKEQVYYPLKFKEKVIGRGFLDFSVEDKIIVELKKDENFTKTSIDQVLNYLKTTDLKLAILINFTKQGVKFKRIINISESKNL
ncbi:MAG: GxxExxY protein [Bacteroidia bacterium]|nr:GxxExxY protein [Bacteroidia bacterium]